MFNIVEVIQSVYQLLCFGYGVAKLKIFHS